MRGRKRDPVIRSNYLRKSQLLEGALDDREREFLLGCQQRLACQQITTGEVSDGQGIAVLAIAEEKFAFVVGTPERIRLGRSGELGARGAGPPSTPTAHQMVTIEHRVDRADGRQVGTRELLP